VKFRYLIGVPCADVKTKASGSTPTVSSLRSYIDGTTGVKLLSGNELLEEVRREAGFCGLTKFAHRPDKAPLVRAFELGVALLAPTLHDPTGNDADTAEITNLLVASDGRLKLTDIWNAAEELSADPGFIARRLRIEHAMYSTLRLSADELAGLVA
jgi:hypothetical protein